MYRLSGNSWRMEWIAIELNPTLLDWSDWIVAPAGAAKHNAEMYRIPSEMNKTDALKLCFAKNE